MRSFKNSRERDSEAKRTQRESSRHGGTFRLVGVHLSRIVCEECSIEKNARSLFVLVVAVVRREDQHTVAHLNGAHYSREEQSVFSESFARRFVSSFVPRARKKRRIIERNEVDNP